MNTRSALHSCGITMPSFVIAIGLLLLVSSAAAGQPPSDYLHRRPTLGERRVERRITERTGPNGVAERRVPPRNRDDRTSYLGMSHDELWKHLVNSRQIAVVGIKDQNAARGYFAGRSLVSASTLESARRRILAIDGVSAAVTDREPSRDFRLPSMTDGRPYPAIIVRLKIREALFRLRELRFVDFVEPLYPHIEYFDGVGCAINAYPGSASDGFLPVAGMSNLVPWVYGHHSIRPSWGLFAGTTAPGFGADLFQMDTGVYRSQRQFWEAFSPPTTPVPRSFSEVLWGGSASATCSHGTRVAGVAAAPADASGFPNLAGIAWGSSLRSQKIGDGVVPVDTPVTGLTGAIMEASNSALVHPLSNKRILLMAWGLPAQSQMVRDAIESAYDSNPNLIMVAAAGTVVPHVVFPATMRRETVAVSMVNAASAAVPTTYALVPSTSGADTVAYGDAVDFVAVNSFSTGLYVPTTGKGVDSAGQSVDKNGNLVPATGLPATETMEVTTIGGSSSATSIIGAGLALVWSRMPWLSRDQVIDRLVASASCGSISGLSPACRDWTDQRVVGAGIPDFYVAAGGARRLWIDGPPANPGTAITINAGMDGDPGLYTFTWSTGATGMTASLTLQPGQVLNLTLNAVNRLDGSTLTATRQFIAAPTRSRTLYATSTIASWSTFFDGHRISSNINAGAGLPAGCFVTGVAGQELTVGGANPGTAFGIPQGVVDRGNRGFTVTRTAFGPESLDVLVTAWHDGTSAIRVRPVYFVEEPAGVDCNSGGATQANP